MKKLSKILQILLYVLPLALLFSYHPVISLGGNTTMNFELSVALLWLVAFDLTGAIAFAVAMVRGKGRELLRRWKCFVWLLLLPTFATVSLAWTANLTRGILTVGLMWLVVIAVMTLVVFGKWFAEEKFRKNFWRWFFGAALFACAWCIIQCILDLAGVARDYSLLCVGCTSQSFGFPHPNGFAVEPQFMGNLLLAPAIAAAWLYLKKQGSKKSELEPSRGRVFYNRSGGAAPELQFRTRSVTVVKNTSGSGFLGFDFLLPCFFIVTATLFLVFSRGAIYAFVVGMMFMSIMLMVMGRKKMKLILKRVGIVWGIVVVAFVFALNMQGLMAQVGPTNDTYVDGVAKVLNQLSLGIIDIRGEKVVENNDEAKNNVVEKPVEKYEDDVAVENSAGTEAIFDGYVEESTEIRKMMTRNAIKTWSQNAKTIAVGVGIGGAGQAMYNAGFTDWPKEIVQNEYANVLLELGIVGAVFALILVVMIVRITLKSAAAPMLLALAVTYGVTLVFFSGMVNALQIYLLSVVLWTIMQKKSAVAK